MVLFSLPSLLGKKKKQGNAGHRAGESGGNTPDSTVYTDIEETLERVFGKEATPQPQQTQRKAPREQFLYNEYNPQDIEVEPERKVAEKPVSPVVQTPEEPRADLDFNLPDAVIYSIVLENPYI